MLEALPESSGLCESFQDYLNEVESLAAEAEVTAPTTTDTPEKPNKKHALVSEFEIDSRPGMRSTKVSQKLRQEKDRANMTSEDEKYTTLVETINEHLKEIFLYSCHIQN
jgi:hypothetical protein